MNKSVFLFSKLLNHFQDTGSVLPLVYVGAGDNGGVIIV